MEITSLPWSLRAFIFAAIAAAESFPYNPTRVLSAVNSSSVYILQPASQSSNQAILQVINIGNGFAISDFTPSTITTSLPFLKDDALVPYTPVIDSSGNITVIAGSCTAGAGKTQVWRFTPDRDAPANGDWIQYQTNDQQLSPGSNLTGTNYLANGMAFSPEVDEDESQLGFYLFGGMCPFTATDASTWVSDAAYSNTMLQLLPDASNSEPPIYDIQSVASRGPAIAEAGFSLTGLPPTYSMNSSGQVHGQQQDFLLVGGHTQGAFINMSNVALFSLPQESWAFVPIQYPSGVKTDLAVRQEESIVEPRSGHTAVLSEDGGSVIVFGGWVGDVSNAAQPQLSVLHLGTEYGGDASLEWTWSIPSESAGIAPNSDGIYGHGATMLPGGIMMIVGGYSISSSASGKTKRDSQTVNDSVFLYNTTSNAWIQSYTPPDSFSFQGQAESKSGGALSKTSQQAGLGVGLGIGALALAGLCGFYLWYSRRLRKQREERQKALHPESSQVSFVQLDQSYMDRPGIDGRGGDMFAGRQSSEMTQAGTTGLWNNIPSPTRGLRNGLSKRPYSYHAAPRYDDRRLNHVSGNIHPIMESEDERSVRGDDEQVSESSAVQTLRNVERVFDGSPREPEQSLRELQRALWSRPSSPIKDPFADPEPNPLGSHPVSPEPETLRRVPTGASRRNSPTRRPISTEMDGSMNWMIVDTVEECSYANSSSNGRISPSRTDDRTSSTLSDASNRSHISATSITRTMSTRTGALLSAALALRRHAQEQDNRSSTAATEERTSTMDTLSSGGISPYNFDNPYGTAQNVPVQRNSMYATAQKSADSFSTAHTSFATLQDQGQALLGGRPVADRDDPYHRAMAATGAPSGHRTGQKEINNPQITAPRRGKGWVGSIRRALTAMSNDRSLSFTGSAVEQLETEPRTSSSSPTRPHRTKPNSSAPRRSASDGGALLRQKRGETDWAGDKESARYLDDPDPGDWGDRRTSVEDRAAENDWDVEGAAGRRDVQITFTVPKARLRVVNADIERASMRSVSDSAMSRTESLRKLRRTESINTVRSRSDGERGTERTYLHSTAEEGLTTGRQL